MKTNVITKLILVGLLVGSLPVVAGDKNPGVASADEQSAVQVKQVKKDEGTSSLSIARGIAYTSMAAMLAGVALYGFSGKSDFQRLLANGGFIGSFVGGGYLAYKEMTEKDANKTSTARKVVAFAIPLVPVAVLGILAWGISQIHSAPVGIPGTTNLNFRSVSPIASQA